MRFAIEKVTKNYLKYRQVDGINVLYLPKQTGMAVEPPKEITISIEVTKNG